ncbi:MAG TPA: alpha-amylase family protein [Kofleriaceae bacterium]|nr:alpha-amylase family protein [Kofleriaceae bacterium]
MEARPRTALDERGLVVGDRRIPFYAGAMHYWRVEPAHWAACLRQLHGLGLSVVETYVPWRVHEPTRGTYAWTGERDLARFLDEAHAAGLAVVIRPGPHVNAELTCFGFPDHVVGDPAIQARTARDTPVWMPSPPRAWPVPSYASTAFHDRVRGWYAEVARVVAPQLAPDGPVVAIGVDNESQMFFRLGAYDHDYHPDAIAWWREHHDGEPPRAFDPADPARSVAWVAFKDEYQARALGAFARMLDDVGLGGLARFHNLPPGHHGLYDVRRLQTAIGGPVGIDAYTPRAEFRELRRRATALVGNAQPIPLALEVGVGFFPWFPPLDAGDDPQRERDQLLALLAAGVRGFNLFMAVERDRYYGAAIAASGAVEPHATWIRSLVAALREVEWPALRRHAQIALVAAKADARFGLATSTLDPMTPVVAEILGLGPGGSAELGSDAGAIAARRWQTAIASALELAQIPYAIVDEAATEDELAGYRAVVVPTLERVDRALWARLRALAEARRTVVVIGPGAPVRDEFDRALDAPPKRMGRLKAGSLDDLPGLAADLAALAEPPETWVVERPDDVRAFAFADAAGRVRVVFVCSDSAKPASAVLIAQGRGLRDPFTQERIRILTGSATIALPARGVRMLIVEP